MTYLRNALLRRAVVAVAALLTAAVAPAKADILIDDFTEPTFSQTLLTGGSIAVPSSPVALGTRGILSTITPTGPSPSATLQIGVASRLGIDLGLDASAVTTISYLFAGPTDFIPNVPGGGTAGDVVITGFGQQDANGVQTSYLLTVTTATGDLTATGNLTSINSPNAIGLAGLSGTGDLTQVTGLTITLTSGAAADLAISNLSVTTPDGVVPAPPAVLLALAAVPALGLRRLRRKTA